MNESSYHSATVVSNESIGINIRHLKIRLAEMLVYEAGQFFMLRLQSPSGEWIERSYSVANFSDQPLIEFVIRIEPHGQMTSLIDQLLPGHQLNIRGPFGKFGGLPGDLDRLILIAGGVGISPLRSILQRSFHRRETFPIELFYGFRTPQDFLFQEELERYRASGRMTLTPVASEGGADWSGKKGLISNFLEGGITGVEGNVLCLVCGPPPMVKASKELLFSMGFDRRQIHLEAW